MGGGTKVVNVDPRGQEQKRTQEMLWGLVQSIVPSIAQRLGIQYVPPSTVVEEQTIPKWFLPTPPPTQRIVRTTPEQFIPPEGGIDIGKLPLSEEQQAVLRDIQRNVENFNAILSSNVLPVIKNILTPVGSVDIRKIEEITAPLIEAQRQLAEREGKRAAEEVLRTSTRAGTYTSNIPLENITRIGSDLAQALALSTAQTMYQAYQQERALEEDRLRLQAQFLQAYPSLSQALSMLPAVPYEVKTQLAIEPIEQLIRIMGGLGAPAVSGPQPEAAVIRRPGLLDYITGLAQATASVIGLIKK